MGDRSFSHVALSVGRGEGPLAARLLTAIGLGVTDNGPSLLGDPWYTALLDPEVHDGRGLDNLGFFVTPISDSQRELEAALVTRLGPELGQFVEAKWGKPDSNPHVALHFSSLETLEASVRAVRSDLNLAVRCTMRAIRPEEAPADLEARLDGSDVFADAQRVRYLTTGVQVFVSTDVVSAGLLCLRQSIELNYEAA